MTVKASQTESIRLTVPPLYIPFSPSTAALAAESEKRSMEFLQRNGLLDAPDLRARAVGIHNGEFVARVCHETTWSEPFQLMSDFTHLAFLLDDYLDGSVTTQDPPQNPLSFLRIAHALFQVIKEPDSRSAHELGVFANAIREVGQRFDDLGNHAYTLRFVRDLREWVTASLWQNADLATGSFPSDFDIVLERLVGIAGHGVFTPFFAFFTPVPVAVEVLDSRPVRDLVELMATICELHNHMLSLGKDLWMSRHYRSEENATGLNVVAHLAHIDDLRPDEALQRAADYANALTGQFMRLYTRMYAEADEATAHYLGDVAQTIRGNYDWHLLTPATATRTDTTPTP